MDLKMWLYEQRVSKKDFASRIKISRCYLHHILSKIVRPSAKLARVIEKATCFQVTEVDLRILGYSKKNKAFHERLEGMKKARDKRISEIKKN